MQRAPGSVIPYDPLSRGSLADVARLCAAEYPQRVQVRLGARALSFEEHFALASGLAAVLQSEHGVVPGSRVACVMRNLPEFSLCFWASMLAGSVFIPINARWAPAEIERALHDASPSVVFADAERAGPARQWSVEAGRPTFVLGESAPHEDLSALLARSLGTHPAYVQVAPDDPATILFTSGTTGKAKGVVHSHRNHLSNLHTLWAKFAAMAEEGAPPPSSEISQLATMPLFHISQLSSLYTCAYRGAELHLMHKWDSAMAAAAVAEHRITDVTGVPMQIAELLDEGLCGADLSSLRMVGIGATMVPPALVSRIWSQLEGIALPMTGYGMTESTSSVTSIGGAEYVARPDSVGRANDIDELRIVGPDGAVLPPGEVGEIWVRGPNVTFERWNGDQIVPGSAAGGWLATGDLGRLDAAGYLFIVDRVKDVIIRSGENVYSSEVENAIRSHPHVADVAIVGTPHDLWGEEVSAVLVLRSPALERSSLDRHLQSRLGKFKIPTRYFLFGSELPRTHTGKILKSELRKMASDGSLPEL